MTAPRLILASERSAAKLLDLKAAEFRSLVEKGVLPRPMDLDGFERWDVAKLEAIARGEKMNGAEDIQW